MKVNHVELTPNGLGPSDEGPHIQLVSDEAYHSYYDDDSEPGWPMISTYVELSYKPSYTAEGDVVCGWREVKVADLESNFGEPSNCGTGDHAYVHIMDSTDSWPPVSHKTVEFFTADFANQLIKAHNAVGMLEPVWWLQKNGIISKKLFYKALENGWFNQHYFELE